jgi:hypothetical protein
VVWRGLVHDDFLEMEIVMVVGSRGGLCHNWKKDSHEEEVRCVTDWGGMGYRRS